MNATIKSQDQRPTAGDVSAPSPALRMPDLLAPAGDWDCVKAAVENGADAIYFGLSKFNARMRAHNFIDADLPKLMQFLHERGVKGYVTFNTLVFADEMDDAERYLRSIITAGADAAIVQDIGICRLIRNISPDFPTHASTQMSITSAAGVEFAKELGCSLVVLARECSIKEIEKIQETQTGQRESVESPIPGFSGNLNPSTLDSRDSSLPLEVFVHGALCVAYSGQCLTSEALGGRSANRGECAQACRMPYELICDGRSVPLGDRRYLLSPQDLAGLEVLPELIRAGVASLKIEGRLKSPEYVANITRVYRKALDRVFSEMQSCANEQHAEMGIQALADASRYDLEMAFSRGLHTGWLRGINNQHLVHARFGKKRGVFLGELSRVEKNSVVLKLQAPLKLGDGVVFDAGAPQDKEEGGRVYQLQKQGDESVLYFGHGDVDFRRIRAGDKLWKTSDPELDQNLRRTFAGDHPRFQRPLRIEVQGEPGSFMRVLFRDELGNSVEIPSRVPLSVAKKHRVGSEHLIEQLGRLGGTPFRLDKFENGLIGSVMVPFSELNRIRREAVRQLIELRRKPKRWNLNQGEGKPIEASRGIQIQCFQSQRKDRAASSISQEIKLTVLVRGLRQLEAALRCGIQTVYCDFEDPKKYRDAVARFREFQASRTQELGLDAATPNQTELSEQTPAANLGRQSEIFVAPPRIFKTGEDWILKLVRSCGADGYLLRNYDHLVYFRDCRRVGDFSFNIANRLAAEYFIHRFGLERVTASYDLNFLQLEALLHTAPPEWFEITLHQHMPMFHMEHCVFCAFLSKGTDYTNCGRPCDKHDVKLLDRVGAEHPLKADAGCRNTVFNARAQTGAEHFGGFIRLGVRNFRLEFVNEDEEQTARAIAKYQQLLQGKITGTELWRDLKLANQLGVTRGQL